MRFVISMLVFLGMGLSTPFLPVARGDNREHMKEKEKAKKIDELIKKLRDAKQQGDRASAARYEKELDALMGVKRQPGFLDDFFGDWHVQAMLITLGVLLAYR